MLPKQNTSLMPFKISPRDFQDIELEAKSCMGGFSATLSLVETTAQEEMIKWY